MSSAEIVALDRALKRTGENCILQRRFGQSPNVQTISLPIRAQVRGYQEKELVGGVVQGDRRVIMSPTESTRAQWPGGLSPASIADPRIPRAAVDQLITANGKTCNVLKADPIYVGNVLVRIELQVRG